MVRDFVFSIRIQPDFVERTEFQVFFSSVQFHQEIIRFCICSLRTRPAQEAEAFVAPFPQNCDRFIKRTGQLPGRFQEQLPNLIREFPHRQCPSRVRAGLLRRPGEIPEYGFPR